MSNWSGLIKRVLTKCAEQAKRTIQTNIKDNLFGQRPFGEHLAQSTVNKKGTDLALIDTGAFYDQMQIRVTNDEAIVYSTGKTKKQQRGFLFGFGHVPPRNAYNKKQPSIGKRFGATEKGGVLWGQSFKKTGNQNDMEGHLVTIAAAMIYNEANKEIHKATSKFK